MGSAASAGMVPADPTFEEGAMIMRGWDPFTMLSRLDDDFDQLVRRSWGTATPTARRGTSAVGFVPAVEMSVDGADVVITLELPGVDVEKDVDIQVHEGRLTISGSRRDVQEEESANGSGSRVLVRELRYGSFRREFALPDGVSPDSVTAHYDCGLLQVRVRDVVRPVEAPRKISVTAGSAPEQKTITGSTESS